MPIASHDIEARILRALPDAKVTLEDLTGGGDHWSAVVVSEAFAGVSRVRRHQMVYRALGEAMTGPIHALALKTFTPDESPTASDPIASETPAGGHHGP